MRKLLLTATLMALALFSCNSKDDNNGGTPKDGSIRFTAGINDTPVKTNAVGDTWEANDNIGVYVVTDGSTLSDVSVVDGQDNRRYYTTDGTTFGPYTTNQTLYYPADGSSVNFVAYYPYSAAIADFGYTVDVQDQSNPAAIDLLYAADATSYNKNSNSDPDLAFYHMLTKFTLSITPGNDLATADMDGFTALIDDIDTKATFNLSTGQFGASSSNSIIPMNVTSSGNTQLAEAIVIPGSIDGGQTVVIALQNGDYYTWTIPAEYSEAGTEYDITLALSDEGETRSVITPSVRINPWDSYPANHNAGKDDSRTPPDYTQIVLNELSGNKFTLMEQVDVKFIELYNNSSNNINIAGMYLMRHDGEKDSGKPVWTAPANTIVPAKGFLVLLSDQSDPALGFSSGLSAKKSLKFELFDPEGNSVDVFKNLDATLGEVWDTDNPKYNTDSGKTSLGRYPDGTGEWFVITTGTPGEENNSGSEKVEW